MWNVTWQNDLVFGTDSNYTNGLVVGWGSEEILQSQEEGVVYQFSRGIRSLLYGESPFSGKARYYARISVQQDMYTPEDLSEEEPIYDDIPYAGHLYARYEITEVSQKEALAYFFKVGMVGPSSGAEQTQKYFHRVTGSKEPKGWDNQLEDEITYGLGMAYNRLGWRYRFDGAGRFDLLFSSEWDWGNFIRSSSIGIIARYGQNYPEVIRIDNSITGEASFSTYNTRYNQVMNGWAVNYGRFINAVTYYYITDKSDKYDLDRKTHMISDMLSLSYYGSSYEIGVSVKAVRFQVNQIWKSIGWGAVKVAYLF